MAKHIALSSNTEQGRIYRQALIDLENKISKLPEPTKGHTMLPLWEAERDLGLEALQAAHKVKNHANKFYGFIKYHVTLRYCF